MSESEAITVEMSRPSGTQRILVPFDVPQALFDMGAVNLYAERLCGWSAEVDGQPNPVSALQAIALRLRSQVRDDHRGLVADATAFAAREQAIAQYDSLFTDI